MLEHDDWGATRMAEAVTVKARRRTKSEVFVVGTDDRIGRFGEVIIISD